MTLSKWDRYFLSFARAAYRNSKDVSTKVGAVIVGRDRDIISTGYNGFPMGVKEFCDREQRPKKLLYVCHAERNALDLAARRGASTKGCYMYIASKPGLIPPCAECAKSIIQCGISMVVFKDGPVPRRWRASCEAAEIMLREAGVRIVKF